VKHQKTHAPNIINEYPVLSGGLFADNFEDQNEKPKMTPDTPGLNKNQTTQR
jgi:hypothetical protein